MKETSYCQVEKIEYKNGTFEGGFVKNSVHKVNCIYLKIAETYIELRKDEVLSILEVLTKTLLCFEISFLNGKKLNNYKFYTLKEIKKMKEEEDYYFSLK